LDHDIASHARDIINRLDFLFMKLQMLFSNGKPTLLRWAQDGKGIKTRKNLVYAMIGNIA
jgi:hypothetical protein